MPSVDRIPVGEVTLAVRTWQPAEPSAPPVMLLPGTGLPAEDWDVVGEQLAQTRVVHAVDLRGHGASDWPGRYSIESMADDVVRLMDHLAAVPANRAGAAAVPEEAVGASRLDLVGHSLGGLVACLVAERRPRLVRRLVLEDVGLPHPRKPAPPERPDAELDFDWRVVEQVRPQIDSPDVGWPDRCRRLELRTLVIAGGDASFVPQEHIRELVGLLPDGRLVTVPAGHEVHAREPAAFLAHLLTFLEA